MRRSPLKATQIFDITGIKLLNISKSFSGYNRQLWWNSVLFQSLFHNMRHLLTWKHWLRPARYVTPSRSGLNTTDQASTCSCDESLVGGGVRAMTSRQRLRNVQWLRRTSVWQLLRSSQWEVAANSSNWMNDERPWRVFHRNLPYLINIRHKLMKKSFFSKYDSLLNLNYFWSLRNA